MILFLQISSLASNTDWRLCRDKEDGVDAVKGHET